MSTRNRKAKALTCEIYYRRPVSLGEGAKNGRDKSAPFLGSLCPSPGISTQNASKAVLELLDDRNLPLPKSRREEHLNLVGCPSRTASDTS